MEMTGTKHKPKPYVSAKWRRILACVVLFFLFSFLGWCWEKFYFYLVYGINADRGFLTLPFCTVYGSALLLIRAALKLPDPERTYPRNMFGFVFYCVRTFYGIIFRADIRCFALDVPRFFARLSGLRLPERQRCLGRADRHLYGGRVGSVGASAFKNPSDRSVLGRRSFNALRCVRFFSYGVFMKSLTGMSENGIILSGDGYV